MEYLRHDGAEVAAISGTLFTASRALVLDTVLRETLRVENPSYGVLVAAPVRDLLLVHVLQDRRVVPAMDLMVTVATQSFREQPGPISPHVYYVADGRWQQVTQHIDGTIRIVVDGPMADAIQRLGLISAAAVSSRTCSSACAMYASWRQINARITTDPPNANQNGAVTPHQPAIRPPIAPPTTMPPITPSM